MGFGPGWRTSKSSGPMKPSRESCAILTQRFPIQENYSEWNHLIHSQLRIGVPGGVRIAFHGQCDAAQPQISAGSKVANNAAADEDIVLTAFSGVHVQVWDARPEVPSLAP